MKCDELTLYHSKSLNLPIYVASEVDAAIDELKNEHHKERHEYIEMVAQLRRENCRLKRAMWLARANRADGEFIYWCARFAVESGYTKADIRGYPITKRKLRTIVEWMKVWKNVRSKCRAKAEEYK